MPITYKIVENLLTQPPSYGGIPLSLDVLDSEDMADLIHAKNPTITPALAESVLLSLLDIVQQQLLDGNNVTLENFVSFYLTIRVKLDNPNDTIRPEQFHVNASIQSEMKADIEALATYSREDYSTKTPVIVSVYDTNTLIVNWIREGFGHRVYGDFLGFDIDDSAQGLFLDSPAGNILKQNQFSYHKNKNIIFTPVLDSVLGPACEASVEYDLTVKVRYTPDGTLREATRDLIRATNVVNFQTTNQLFVTGSALFGPVTVMNYEGVLVECRVLCYLTPLDALVLSVATLTGDFGPEVEVTGDDPVTLTGLPFDLLLLVTDFGTLYQSALDYSRYFQEVVALSPIVYTIINDAFVLTPLSDPVGTGDIWADTCSNVQVFPISNDRFVWIGYNPLRNTQTVVGSVSPEGVVTFGSLVDLEFLPLSFEHNTFGGFYIGDGLFSRYHEDTGAGFAVWDAGSSGLSATMVNSNDNSVTCIPAGYQAGILFSGGMASILDDQSPPGICVYEFTGDTVTSETTVATGIWGVSRDVASPNYINGCPAPGGVLYVARTADLDLTSNTKMEVMFCNTSTGAVVRAQCSDLDGTPAAISCQSDGVFVFSYLIVSTGELRFRSGTLLAGVISFGDSFDYYSVPPRASTLTSASGVSLGNNRFVMATLGADFTTPYDDVQTMCAVYTDGTLIYTLDPVGGYWLQDAGDLHLDVIVTDVSNILLSCCYGRTGNLSMPDPASRYVSPFDVDLLHHRNLVSGKTLSVSHPTGTFYTFYRFAVPFGTTVLAIDIDNTTGFFGFNPLHGAWPVPAGHTCLESEINYVNNFPSPGFWYAVVCSEGGGDFDITMTIT